MISSVDFCKVYIPAAKAGKNALEIGQQLGVVGTDDQISKFVTVRASQIRAVLKKTAEKTAKDSGLSDEESQALVETTVAKVPTLKSRNRQKSANLVSAIDAILAEANAE